MKTEKIKKAITLTLEFPADFIPPDEFEISTEWNDWKSECEGCPFYQSDFEGREWCGYPEKESLSDSCPIKKYFE